MSRRIETLMWIGVAAPPIAWMLEHGFGFGVSEANCSAVGPQWGVAFSTWIIVVTAATGALSIAGLLAAIVAYRAVRSVDTDDPPPAGRVWLLSVFALITTPILLAIIVLSGVGTLVLGSCTQS